MERHEEFSTVVKSIDQEFYLDDVLSMNSSFYKKESDLIDSVVKDIEYLTEHILSDKYISHKREFDLSSQWGNSNRNRKSAKRIDLLIRGKKQYYLLEFKNPKYPAENLNGIGQLLCYSSLFLDPKKELILLTTKYDHYTFGVLKSFAIPIRYFYIDEQVITECHGWKET